MKTNLTYYGYFQFLVDKERSEALNSVFVCSEGSIFREVFGPLPQSRRFGNADRDVSGAVGGTGSNLAS